MKKKKFSFGKALDCLSLFPYYSSCLSCQRSNKNFADDYYNYSYSTKSPSSSSSTEEKKPLIANLSDKSSLPMKLKDVIADQQQPPTLAFQLKPKSVLKFIVAQIGLSKQRGTSEKVVLRVSMHCNGCARKVEKHISKLEGVSWYQIDLETKMVVITGDIVPFEVLESVSKVKNAELWNDFN